MRKILVFCCAMLGALSLYSQEISPEAQAAMIEKVEACAAQIKSLECEFVQTKQTSMLEEDMSSRGNLYFVQEGRKLHWEYKSPNKYTFVINGDSIMIESATGKSIIDISQNRMFSELASIVMNCLTGKCLSSKSDFRTKMDIQDGVWIAELTPLRREILQLFRTIRFYFNEDLSMIKKVEMVERRGDTTIVEFKNVKLNRSVNDNLFKIEE